MKKKTKTKTKAQKEKPQAVASFSLEAGKAEHYQDIEQDEMRMRVPFTIFDGNDKKVVEMIESFPITATVEEIQEVLQRHLDVFAEDYQRHEANKERDAQMAQSQEVANRITGLTL